MRNILHVYTSPNHGSSVLRHWPVTHVTHSHLLTHLTYDPLTHCMLWYADIPPRTASFTVNLTCWSSWLFHCVPSRRRSGTTDLQSCMLAITHTSQHSQHELDVAVILLTDVIKLVISISLRCCCCCCWLLILIICYLHTPTFQTQSFTIAHCDNNRIL